MPTFEDFLDDIKKAGVYVEGEAILRDAVANSSDWTKQVATLALSGRKQRVEFQRMSVQQPSNEQLAAIIRGYPFSPQDTSALLQNTFPIEGDDNQTTASQLSLEQKLNQLRERFSRSRK